MKYFAIEYKCEKIMMKELLQLLKIILTNWNKTVIYMYTYMHTIVCSYSEHIIIKKGLKMKKLRIRY